MNFYRPIVLLLHDIICATRLYICRLYFFKVLWKNSLSFGAIFTYISFIFKLIITKVVLVENNRVFLRPNILFFLNMYFSHTEVNYFHLIFKIEVKMFLCELTVLLSYNFYDRHFVVLGSVVVIVAIEHMNEKDIWSFVRWYCDAVEVL